MKNTSEDYPTWTKIGTDRTLERGPVSVWRKGRDIAVATVPPARDGESPRDARSAPIGTLLAVFHPDAPGASSDFRPCAAKSGNRPQSNQIAETRIASYRGKAEELKEKARKWRRNMQEPVFGEAMQLLDQQRRGNADKDP